MAKGHQAATTRRARWPPISSLGKHLQSAVKLVTIVNMHVLLLVTSLRKLLIADFSFVGLLLAVNENVLIHVTDRHKGLVAELACVKILITMDQHVDTHRGFF